MARAVAKTFAHGGVLVVEAGTGTGKSLAYLVPAIHWSLEHGERVIVSTNTINLQEQLVGLDLPFLEQNLGRRFTAVLIKGRGNYLCLRKAAEIRQHTAPLFEDRARDEVNAILEWSATTEDGSLADLDFVPRPEAWAQVATEHDDCLRSRCPEYESCFFYKARRRAAQADVLVVNHHLLMADLSLRAVLSDDAASGILPAASRLVVDEAHHLEDVATDYFGAEVTLRRIDGLLARLQHPKTHARGLLPALLERLAGVESTEDRPAAEGALRWIDERLSPGTRALAADAAECFGALLMELLRSGQLTAADRGEERTLRIVGETRDTDLWRAIDRAVAHLIRRIESFVGEIEPVLGRLERLSPAAMEKVLFLRTALGAYAGRLSAVAADLARFVGDDPDLCRWIALRQRGSQAPTLVLAAAPVEVGPRLREALFDRFESVVLTSATLTVDRRFDYFAERSGLSRLPAERLDRLRLDSPFRFDEQAVIAVPEDLPPPDTEGYEQALHETIARAVEGSRGGAFVLFTSYGALDRAWTALERRLHGIGLRILRQGEASRHATLERFRADRRAVLFATDSFWEGVDVRGEGLRLVVITRLPFRVPTEPVQQARAERVEASGGNPFAEFSLPQAVIKLRQGFGRLIRSRGDTGVVAILDSRIVRRRYGEVFLNSLPPARLVVGPRSKVLGEIEAFFR